MRNIKFVFIALLLPLVNIYSVNVRNLTIRDGLSSNSVLTIYQDSKQRMWFGSWNGLNRFDGTQLQTWFVGTGNPDGLDSNLILSIAEDEKGSIWLTTEHSICRFEEQQGRFRKYPCANMLLVMGGKDEILAFASGAPYLYSYIPSTDTFERLLLPEGLNHEILSLFYWKGSFWSHTKEGMLFRYHIHHNDKQGIVIDRVEEVCSEQTVFSVTTSPGSVLWLVKYDGWIVKKNPEDGSEELFVNILPELNFESRTFQDDTHVWVDPSNTYLYVNYKSGGVCKYAIKEKKVVETYAKDTKVTTFYHGTQDVLWVASDEQGIFQFSPDIYPFHNFPNEMFGNAKQKMVRCFHLDKQDNLWIGTKGDGIFRLDRFSIDSIPAYTSLKHYTERDGLLNDQVWTFCENKQGDLMIGTDGAGMTVYDMATGQFQAITGDDPAILDSFFKYIYVIYQDNDGFYWLGLHGGGLVKLALCKENGKYKVLSYKRYTDKDLLIGSVVTAIVPQNDSILWVTTRGSGITIINMRAETAYYLRSDPENQSSISGDDAYCLYQDRRKAFWVGTSSGLNVCAEPNGPNTYAFDHYTVHDGLPNNSVRIVQQGADSSLWIATSTGLCRLNGTKLAVFDYRSGLLDNEFAENAGYYNAVSNMLFFGGNKGFSCFYANEIQDYPFTPSILLTDFKLHNKSVCPESYMNEDRAVCLSYNQNFFTLTFTAVDYIGGDLPGYMYRLKGLSDEWLDAESNSCNFTNVLSGEYLFQVKNKQTDQVVYSLPFYVAKPWWKHPLAYSLYFMVVLSVLYLSFRLYSVRMTERNALLIERMNRKKEEEMHESKLSFFTNIAHELSTPLTLVNGRCEKVLSLPGLSPEVRRYVSIIRNNTDRMNSLMKQIMEFRKAETGNLKIVIQPVSVPAVINRIVSDFRDLLDENKIDLTHRVSSSIDTWPTDLDCLEKIMYNLFSNAVKYTPVNGRIEVDVNVSEDRLHLIVTNTGQGIKPEDLPLLFNRFKILDNYERSLSKRQFNRNGIGLSLCNTLVNLLKGKIVVESQYGEKTTFRVTLPLLPVDVVERPVKECEPEDKRTYFETIIKNDLRSEDALEDSAEKQDRKVTDPELPHLLIADDNQEIQEMLRDSLSQKFQLTFASDGEEALTYVKQFMPDLIISDVMMPVMDGNELTRRLKADKLLSHIPVILLSSKVSMSDQEKGLNAGADAYVPKPFQSSYLHTLISQLLVNRIKLKDYYNSPANLKEYHDGKISDKSDREFLENLNRVIQENLPEPDLSPEYLSVRMNISRVQLYRKLKALTEQSPAEYIRRLRFAYCCKLLLTTDMSVQEIVYQSGFSSTSFYREFTKTYNCSPKEYRDRGRETDS